MAKELVINSSLPEVRIAYLESGKIQELIVERGSENGIVGNIYKGRVTRVLPGMQAAFVDIGLDKAAFLYVDDVVIHEEKASEEEVEEMVGDVFPNLVEDASEEEGPDEMEARGEDFPDDPELDGDEAAAEGLEASSDLDPDATEEIDTDPTEEISTEEMSASSEDAESAEDSEEPVSDEGEPEDPEGEPMNMSMGEDEGDAPEGTVAPPAEDAPAQSAGSSEVTDEDVRRVRRKPSGGRRGRRGRGRRGRGGGSGGGRFRGNRDAKQGAEEGANLEAYPENLVDVEVDDGQTESDRADLSQNEDPEGSARATRLMKENRRKSFHRGRQRPMHREKRDRGRRVRSRSSFRRREQQKIDQLLKEGQEVIVQVAKDPIANKGARLTCHVSLPGRHLVCMPTIDHVGVSRRIDLDSDRRRLRNFVEKNRPEKMGFIVRTATGSKDAEQWIAQDIDYLSNLWKGIKEEADKVSAPAIVYEDLNPVLRSIRDWATEDIHKIIVDSRYFYNEIRDFVGRFMPNLLDQVELYHGDIPIFDAYGVSTELHRALERRVWLRSGGYIVIDQAEALVAIDVNTGRYVGKKNLEDTILKTNLEAVEEIAYQLRLRNCGGIVIMDLIDMEKQENRDRVLRTLEMALQKDRSRPTVVKMSDLGLIEMTRKRTRDTLIRTLCQTCNHCEGKGFVKSRLTVANDVLREVERAGVDRDVRKICIQAHPEVIDILSIDEKETLDMLERRYRKEIYLQAVEDFHPEQFDVSGDEPKRRTSSHSRARQTRGRSQSSRSRGGGGRGRSGSRRGSSRRSSSSDEKKAPAPAAAAAAATEGNGADHSAEPGNVAAPGAAPKGGEDMDEEDRLAFLRAQAAQDAALANLSESQAGNSSKRNSTSNSNNSRRRTKSTRGRRGGRGGRGGRSGGSRSSRGARARGGGGNGGGNFSPPRF